MTTTSEPPRSRSEDIEARYHALTEIGRALVQNLAQDTILQSIADWISGIVPFDRIGLMVYEQQTDSRRIFAITGRSRSAQSVVGTELTRDLHSHGWRAFDELRPIVSHLTQGTPLPLERRLYREGLRSLVALPLILNGEGMGTFNLASVSSGRFAEADITFLEEAAHQIALAIGNIRSGQEIAMLRAALENESTLARDERPGEDPFPEIIGRST